MEPDLDIRAFILNELNRLYAVFDAIFIEEGQDSIAFWSAPFTYNLFRGTSHQKTVTVKMRGRLGAMFTYFIEQDFSPDEADRYKKQVIGTIKEVGLRSYGSYATMEGLKDKLVAEFFELVNKTRNALGKSGYTFRSY
jgi:hypothetical protein